MHVSVESAGSLERKMTVQLPAERIGEEVEKRLRALGRRVKVHGFRPGKVPFKVVKQRFGGEVYQEVVGELLQSSFREAAMQEKLQPAGSPQIELTSGEMGGVLEYVATFEIYPELSLAPVDGLQITCPTAEVQESDVDAMIETLRKQRTDWLAIDRPAAEGDRVVIDFKGFLGDEPFEGGEAKDHAVVLGQGRMIADFERQLVGASVGEEKSLDVGFPEDYHAKDLAGKAARFDIVVKSVSEPRLPEIDEAFVSAFGVASGGEEALRKEVRANMERELQQAIKERAKTRVMDALHAANEVPVPGVLVQAEIRRMRDQVGEAMSSEARQGLPDNLFEEQARRRVALGLLIGELVRSHEISLDVGRVDVTLEGLAAGYEEPEQVVRYYRSNREAMAGIEALVLEDQVVDWVIEHASVEQVAMTFDQVMHPEKNQEAI
ncbi:trigger factor [Acidihalobacter yilgarnensis]|uniref:Trigger factor n=1 Tax=Acidihalobacter yilgarnensis TaxID=2819280 RepID=A0A1D8ISX8_9GAMM|nr:trigger factor [Acidihalobacter yilgarnensis]AOU99576.1 trigger factor [Acidihalobacter yilgarnensis]